MPKINKITTYEKLNLETGEIITEQKTQMFSVVNGDKYVKMFTENILEWLNLDLTKLEFKIVIYIVSNINYENEINIDLQFKEQMSKDLEIPMSSIKKALTSIYKTKILYRGKTRGKYYINPIYFGKGKHKDLITLADKITKNKIGE